MAADAFEAIAEDMAFLDDWQDRYRHIIDLGKTLTPLEDARKSPAAKVDGCASQVWLIPEIRQSGGRRIFRFEGDSDALIVKGLIAVLMALYNGTPLREIAAIDADAQLGRLELHGHLSSQRSNGLRAMVARIRQIAESAAPATAPPIEPG